MAPAALRTERSVAGDTALWQLEGNQFGRMPGRCCFNGVPLEEMVAVPGTVPIKNGHVRPTDAPGFGFEVTKDWVEERTVSNG